MSAMNLDALLQPISPDAPSGDDLSFSDEFDAIAQDRRADDPTLDQGEWKTEIKLADWPAVEQRCTTLLSTRTKDLRLLGWLTEALAQRQGFGGLADGLQLCARAAQAFWPNVHPLPDGGDQEQRIGNLGWLLTQIVSLAHGRALVDAGPGRRYALREIEAARLRQADPDGDAPEGLTAQSLSKALQATPAPYVEDNLAQARRAREALTELQSVVDGLLGDEGPGFVAARTALDDVIHAAERLARERGVRVDGGAPMAGALAGAANNLSFDGQAVPQAHALPQHTVTAHLQTRAQALRQLQQVAEFFRQTEPHSPVAYLADKAVHWAHMPLHEWLRAVLKDGGSLAHVEELLGVPPSPSV
ncbi:MAG TPA: type VI secretion system protein TssA [Candidatus Aquabacterium excrementipullorum]|nr:type VI secretion system protein TssA [Candidatus Aquabacterium excrementipullorum]